jgi:hypothetical protein
LFSLLSERRIEKCVYVSLIRKKRHDEVRKERDYTDGERKKKKKETFLFCFVLPSRNLSELCAPEPATPQHPKLWSHELKTVPRPQATCATLAVAKSIVDENPNLAASAVTSALQEQPLLV